MSGLDPRPLAEQIALVTGAAAGIGREVAITLARAGCHVALVDVDEPGLSDTSVAVSAEGSSASKHTVDLAQRAAIVPLVENVLEQWSRIDILVNCAGITGAPTGVTDTDLDDWDRVFAVNLDAPFLLMQNVARHMIARAGGGRIVNITSSSAHRARLSIPAYGASKSGLLQLTRSAAAELGPHGITVNAVAPGLTRTAIVDSRFTAEQLHGMVREGPVSNLVHRVSEPQDVAEAVLFLCSPGARQITAQTLHVSGGAIV